MTFYSSNINISLFNCIQGYMKGMLRELDSQREDNNAAFDVKLQVVLPPVTPPPISVKVQLKYLRGE